MATETNFRNVALRQCCTCQQDILQPIAASQIETLRRRTNEESKTTTVFPFYCTRLLNLTLEGKAGAELVAGLVELLGIERAANAEGQTAVDLGVVGEGGNAEVVDLGLRMVSWVWVLIAREITHLGEGSRVKLVLGSELKTDVGAGLGVPGGLGTGLDSRVDLLVVGGGEDAQGVGGSDGGVVERGGVANGGAVLGDGGLLDVVADLTTNDEALVGDDSVGDGTDGTGSGVVGEDTAVEVGLLEVEVDLLALVAGSRAEVGEDLSLQAAGKGVVELDLSSENVGGVPRLGDADAWALCRQQVDVIAGEGTRAARRLRYVKDASAQCFRLVDLCKKT